MITMVGNYICKDCQDSMAVIEREHLPIEFHDMRKELSAVREYLRIREEHPELFDQCRKDNTIGIPVFVLDDGTVTFDEETAYEAARRERRRNPQIVMVGSRLCVHCRAALARIEAEDLPVEFHEMTENLGDMKLFLKIREENEALYEKTRKENRVGIPVFLLKDGTVTKDVEQALEAARKEKKECE